MATLESRTTSPEAAFHKFTVEAWSLLSAALAITGIRIAFRVSAIGARHLCWDDYLVCVGALFYVVETTLAYSVGNVAHGLANGGMTDEQRAALSPEDPEHRLRIIGSKIQIAGWTTYGTMLWLYKTCMLITYARLTAGLSKSYRKQVYGGFALLAATFIALLGITFFSCRPFHKYWQINPNPGTVCQPALSIQIIWSNLALNATTDLYLMTIPVPMLWKSGLKLSKKIAWTILLTSGVFIVACALLRSIFITIDPINGPQTAGAWGVRESFVATVVTNLPIIFPRLQHYFKKHLGPILSLRSSQSNQFPTDFQTIGGGGRGKRSAEARNLDAYPLPTKLTVTESAEQLVDEPIELENGTLGTLSRRNSHGHEQHAHAESSKAHGT